VSTNDARQQINRFGMVGDLALSVRRMIKRAFLPLLGLCLIETLLLWFTGQTSTAAFAMLAVGSCIALASWKEQGKGLPLMPMMVAQTMLIYGLPIAIGHEFLTGYSEEYITRAGIELLVFLTCLTGFWRLGMTSFMPGRSLAYVLREFNKSGYKAIAKVGMVLIVCTTTFQLLQSLGLLDSLMNALPSGAASVVSTLVMSATVCGCSLTRKLASVRGSTSSSASRVREPSRTESWPSTVLARSSPNVASTNSRPWACPKINVSSSAISV